MLVQSTWETVQQGLELRHDSAVAVAATESSQMISSADTERDSLELARAALNVLQDLGRLVQVPVLLASSFQGQSIPVSFSLVLRLSLESVSTVWLSAGSWLIGSWLLFLAASVCRNNIVRFKLLSSAPT